MRLRERALARPPAQLLKADAQGNRAGCTHGLLRHFEELAHDAHSIRKGSAIGIRAPIPFWQQKFVRQIAHAGIHVDDVKACALGLARRFRLPAQKIRDVRGIHGLGALIGHEADVCRHPGNPRRRQRRQAARAVRYRSAAVPELDSCKRAMLMDGIGHERVRADVVVIPERRVRQG